jgi:hypothetical protein
MPTCSIAIPLQAGALWFEEDPGLAGLSPGPGSFFEVTIGKPDMAFVEPILRRRLSRLARGAFHCANQVSPPGDVRFIFASRHGEADRTLALLQDLAAGAELSPNAFSMSVHNAVPGLWSILRQNHAPATAIAAGPETFGWGLVQAFAAWAEQPACPVLYVFGDDRLPEPWDRGQPPAGPHALALVLGQPARRRLTLDWDPEDRGAPASRPQAMHCLERMTAREPLPPEVWVGAAGTWNWDLT